MPDVRNVRPADKDVRTDEMRYPTRAHSCRVLGALHNYAWTIAAFCPDGASLSLKVGLLLGQKQLARRTIVECEMPASASTASVLDGDEAFPAIVAKNRKCCVRHGGTVIAAGAGQSAILHSNMAAAWSRFPFTSENARRERP